MNDTFKWMSDLVADAEDLLDKIARSRTPEVQLLAARMRVSIDRMEDHLRDRLRYASEEPAFASTTSPYARRWLLAVTAAGAAGLLFWAYRRSRR
jgi:hypothetical protein